MGRTPKQPRLVNSVQLRLLRQEFLQIVHATCPEVFRQLMDAVNRARDEWANQEPEGPALSATDLRFEPEEIVRSVFEPCVADWAKTFGATGTWIEEEARAIASRWVRSSILDLRARLPLAVLTQESGEESTFTLSVPIPFELRSKRPYFRWENLEKHLRQEVSNLLESELVNLKRDLLLTGEIDLIIEPSEIQTKFEVTALYLFRLLSPQRIGSIPGYAHERTSLNRWITEVVDLLDLDRIRRNQKRPRNAVKTVRFVRSK